jgi:signal transduction histidine kinase
MTPAGTTTLRLRRYRGPLDVVRVMALTVALLWGSVREADTLSNGRPDLPHPGAASYALVTIACLVLIWRRRWPLAVFCVSLGAVLLYTGFGYADGASLIAPMIALYEVTATGTTRRSVLLSSVTVVCLLAVDILFGPFGLFGGSVTVIPFEVVATMFLGLAVANRRAYVAEIHDRAERAERTREEEARRRVDAERLRIARELHDVVAHSISVINVQARVASHVIPDPPEAAAQALTAIKDASAEALRELRTMLGLLRQADESAPTEPPPGLDHLEMLVSAADRADLSVKLTLAGEPCRLPPIVDLAAYRIVQESLTNAMRYAGSAQASVSISYTPDAVVIEVEDDGRGAITGNVSDPEHQGYGIMGMRERARAVGGDLDAGPLAAGGFRVHARLPMGGSS